MDYADVSTGISAATVAWKPLGWKAQFYSEIEPFPNRLLNHHYPHVPNLGDMNKLLENEIFKKSVIDLLVGGTPCQEFSIAGLRGGISTERGNLTLQYCRILIAKRPKWFVWENVPGIFSSFSDDSCYLPDEKITQTADFATLLQAFQECGYCCAWRVLDAQYFGVPQRRRRVFVVGYLGNDWRPPATVLFDAGSLQGNFTPSKKKRKDITGTLDSRTSGGGFPGSDGAASGHIVACSLTASLPKGDRGEWDNKIIVMATGQGNTEISEDLVPTLSCNYEKPILFSIMPMNSGKDYKARVCDVTQPLMANQGGGNQGSGNQGSGNQGSGIILQPVSILTGQTGGNGSNYNDDGVSYTLDRANSQAIYTNIVRRLTPLECERLQGFPDNYTNIPGASDTARYKAIGNSMAVPVMRWIGERIQAVDNIIKSQK